MNTQVTKETQRFYLREITAKDIHHIHRGLSDPKVTEFYDVHFPSLEATKEQMEWYKELKAKGTGLWWGIFSKEDHTFYGAGGYNSLDATHRRAEIGLWLLPEYWGHGIFKEVMPALFDLGFEQLKLNRIEGYVEGGNEKCKKALKKINFQHEGTMRSHEFKNGNFIDVDIFALVQE